MTRQCRANGPDWWSFKAAPDIYFDEDISNDPGNCS